jgi:hypothetical protein
MILKIHNYKKIFKQLSEYLLCCIARSNEILGCGGVGNRQLSIVVLF